MRYRCFIALSVVPIVQQILYQLRTISDTQVEKSIDVNLKLKVYEHVQVCSHTYYFLWYNL